MIYTKNLRALVESDELRDVNFSGFAFISELNVRGIFSADFLFFGRRRAENYFYFPGMEFLFFSPLTRSHAAIPITDLLHFAAHVQSSFILCCEAEALNRAINNVVTELLREGSSSFFAPKKTILLC